MSWFKKTKVTKVTEEKNEAVLREEGKRIFEVRRAEEKLTLDNYVERYCRKATVAEYATWLAGYLAKGFSDKRSAQVTHVEAHNFVKEDAWFTLTKNPTYVPVPEYHPFNLLVPSNISLLPENIRVIAYGPGSNRNERRGRRQVYFLHEFRLVGGNVPTFPDVIDYLNR